jgi:hypothetical protein
MKTLKSVLVVFFVSFVMLLGFSSCDFYFGKHSETKESKYSLDDTNPVIKEYPIPRPITKQDLINAFHSGYLMGGIRQKFGSNLNKTWAEDSTYFVGKFR